MIYALVVALLSLVGAALPLWYRPGHASLQVYLSLAAGALLGAAMFHLLPESSVHMGEGFGLPVVLGIAVVFFLQRYLAPHSHEPASGTMTEVRGLSHGEAAAHEHKHHHEPGTACNHQGPSRSAGPLGVGKGAPLLSGLIAIVALSIHSFFDGVALGAAVGGDGAGQKALGAAVFLSVLIHKPMDGLSVSVLLMHGGASRRVLWAVQIGYALLVPIGAAAFLVTRAALPDASPLVGYTLAFSGGTFLAIALTDLLPELHFHTHDRHKLSIALLAGLLVMWLTSLLGHGGHEESHEGYKHATLIGQEQENSES